jgi:gamma-glutamyltranspeptidase/glutathione hydrolase
LAVDAPRLHHQWFPDMVHFEGVKQYPDLVGRLKGMGHKIKRTPQGDAHSIWFDPMSGSYRGAADTRISGKVSGY